MQCYKDDQFIIFFCHPPRSAFFIFCAEFRPKVKGETPGLTIGDVAKRLGEMWNGTASEDKQPYEKKAAKLKEKYEKVKRCWFVAHLSCSAASPSSAWNAHYHYRLFLFPIIFLPLLQDVAAYRAKGKPGAAAPGKAPAKVEKKDDDDDDDDDDEEEEEDDDDDDDE